MRFGVSVAVVLVAAFTTTTALQDAQPSRAQAALVLAEGAVFLNDVPVGTDAKPSMLPDGAVVRTARGRAVVALKRGGWLFLDADASVRVEHNQIYNFNRLEAISGASIVASATNSPSVICGSEIRLSSAGIFRFDILPVNASGRVPCQFRVFEGAAAVPASSVTKALRAGESMTCSRKCSDLHATIEFSPSQLDEFDQWARRAMTLFR